MVFEKYYYRDGKKYGPYLYENKRVGDKVVTRYLGRGDDKRNHKYKLALYFLLIFIGVFSMLFVSQEYSVNIGDAYKTITGYVTSEVLGDLSDESPDRYPTENSEENIVFSDSDISYTDDFADSSGKVSNSATEEFVSDVISEETVSQESLIIEEVIEEVPDGDVIEVVADSNEEESFPDSEAGENNTEEEIIVSENDSIDEDIVVNESEDVLNESVQNPVLNESVEDDFTLNESIVENESLMEDVVSEEESASGGDVLNNSWVNVSLNDTILNETVLGNITNDAIFNQTIINETIENITNETIIELISVDLVQYSAEIGKPVRWEKTVLFFSNSSEFIVSVPTIAENISVLKQNDEHFLDVTEDVKIKDKTKLKLKEKDKEKKSDKITGNVVFDLEENNFWSLFFDKIISFFRWTGFAISDDISSEINLTIEDTLNQNDSLVVEYYTPAPYVVENNLSDEIKEVVVVGPEEVHYKDILAYSDLPYEVEKDKISLIWKNSEAGEDELVNFISRDKNSNGLIDSIEWVVPHLSNQTYQIIILMTNALHLDENKSFVSDIYDYVKTRDKNWSELVNPGEYVRVRFERNLTSVNDITIYARSNGTSEIEVYEQDGNEVVAKFENVSADKRYRVYLTNLISGQDTFDLKILNNSVEFDFIIDPDSFYATGGDITYDSVYGYTIHTFTTDGTFEVVSGSVETQVEVLVIGGGGGGSYAYLGGGGGGQVIENTGFSISEGEYSVTVGAGGAEGYDGEDSVFSSITAYGGKTDAGGGVAGYSGSGYAGGNEGSCDFEYCGGGGGGDSSAGTHAYIFVGDGGGGGSGTYSSITGGTYGGGGGGAGTRYSGAGVGGGADGSSSGGGGGGGYTSASGTTGGDGVVIIRYGTDANSPTLDPVSIVSNNADTTLAKVDDNVTITFTTSESLNQTPTVTIDGKSADSVEDLGSNQYSATRTMQIGDTSGAIAFTIDFFDLTGNAGTQVTSTTDSSYVTFDETAPTLDSVNIVSDNSNTAYAKVGDTVAISFTASEVLLEVPTVAINGNSADAVNDLGSNQYTATRTMQIGDTEGEITFAINFTDAVGNIGISVTSTTDSSSVTFDETAPNITFNIPAQSGNYDETPFIPDFSFNDSVICEYSTENTPENWNVFSSCSDFSNYIPSEGLNYLTLRGSDSAGNEGNTSTISFNYETYSIFMCRNLSFSGTYSLQTNIGAGNDCLIIAADGVTINGAGYTITGNVDASGTIAGADAYDNLTIINTIIDGEINANGAYSEEDNGGNGGLVTLIDSTLGNLTSEGGESYLSGGNGGSVSLINSNIATIKTLGGYSLLVKGGDGGNITLTDSVVTTLIANGGNASIVGDSQYGGSGGFITITNSNVTTITTNGGAGYLEGGDGGGTTITNSNVTAINAIGGYSSYLSGGLGGSINLTNSTVSTLIASGGNSDLNLGDYGGPGGSVTITNSNVTTITTNGGEGDSCGGVGGVVTIESGSRVETLNSIGGYAYNGNGGFGGNVTITNSTILTINLYGGEASGVEFGTTGGSGGSVKITNSEVNTIDTVGGLSREGTGGSGGAVTITNSNLNLSSFSVNVAGGDGVASNGTAGTLKLNQTSLYNAFGDVKFSYVSTNETNFTKIMSISKNLVYVNSSNYVDYNKSANVTLGDNPGENLSNPVILKDGFICLDCYNFTALNASVVIFNVSSWSNYSIGSEGDRVYPQFSNYLDNNNTLIDSGVGLFNVTVENTNGTVLLEINGTNVTATNLSGNIFNASYEFSTFGTYPYKWHSWGSGHWENYNSSETRNYFVNESDKILPLIQFVSPTPEDGSNQSVNSIYVNVSSSDDRGEHFVVNNFDDSLVSWWRMDDVNASGTGVIDYMGRNNGTAVGGAVQNSSGKFGESFSFDGSNDYVNLGDISLADNSAFAILLWMKTINTGTSQITMFSESSTSSDTPFITFRANTGVAGQIDFAIRDNAGVTVALSNGTTYNDGNWHFASIVKENASSWKLYIDGSLKDTDTGTIGALTTNTNSIGSLKRTANAFYFNGSIDELILFNRSLSEQEIKALYNASVNKYYNNFTSLAVGNHNVKAYAVDSAGNVNSTETRTINLDFSSPNITIHSPENKTYNNGTILVNISASDENGIDKIWYNWNGTNATYSSAYYVNFPEGNYNLTAWTNDSGGNVKNANVSFAFKYPKVSLERIYPTGNMDVGQNLFFNVTLNVTCLESDCGNVNVSFDPMNDIIINGDFETGDLTGWTNNNGAITSDSANSGSYALDLQRYVSGSSEISQAFNPTSAGNYLTLYVYGYVESCCDYANIAAQDSSDNWHTLHEFNGETYGSWTKLTYDISAYLPVKAVRMQGSNDIGDVSTFLVDDICISDANGNCISGRKGLISTVSGDTPFYTNESNPRTISLNAGQSQLVTAWVNATGDTGNYTFFEYVNRVEDVLVYNETEEYIVGILSNTAPNVTQVILNSSAGTNYTNEDLNCYVNITDAQGGNVYANYTWYKNGVANLSGQSSEFSAGTIGLVATLGHGNTTKGENWTCSANAYDGIVYEDDWTNSTQLTIRNSLPTVTLSSPEDGASVTNRTPTFEWTSSDADGDEMFYDINITAYTTDGDNHISGDDRDASSLEDKSYMPTSDLNYLYDNGYYYKWQVKAFDGEEYGEWTENRIVNVSAIVSMNLVNRNVDFGFKNVSYNLVYQDDTSDDSPSPIVIENDGNSKTNITISSTKLFLSTPTESDAYRFKVDNVSGFEGAFNWLLSIIDWTNVPITGNSIAITELNYSGKDRAEVDLAIKVPTDEPEGARAASINFTAYLAE